MVKIVWVGLFCVICLLAVFLYVTAEDESALLPQESSADISQVSLAYDLPDGPEPKDDAVVFEIAYRGLESSHDEYAHIAHWGFGHPEGGKSEFIKSVEKVATNAKAVYNPSFKGAEWAAIEYDGEKPKMLYFDVNADGELSADERISPCDKPDKYGRIEFVTPDFVMTTQDDRKVPFRTFVQATPGNINGVWCPLCVLQGCSEINGAKVRLTLLTNGFSGLYTEFGVSKYAMKEEDGGNEHSGMLSSLINYGDVFYHMRFLKSLKNETGIRVVLEKDTSDIGEVAIKPIGNEGVKVKLNHAGISGAADETINFVVGGGKAVKLPVGEYVIDRGRTFYGKEKDDDFWVSFSAGPTVKVEAGELLELEIGEPRIKVIAIDRKDRDRSDVEDATSFEKGTTVFLWPLITGMASERYSSFNRFESSRRVDVEPTLEIRDAGGKVIASGTMEYG
jgi:hypothetical protein